MDIRILLVEDHQADAALIDRALRAAGIEFSLARVKTKSAMAEALPAQPDIVICDYRLPAFSAEVALQMVRDSGLDIPFILASGYIGEDAAVAMMRAGACDFVRKDSLHRLGPAVQRALREAESRRQRREAEDALRQSESRFRLLAEHSQDAIFRCHLGPRAEVVFVSAAAATVTGYPASELLGPADRVFAHITDADERALFEETWRSGTSASLIVHWRRPDGSIVWLEQRTCGVYEAGELVAVEGNLRDITERVLAERERDMLVRQLEQAERIESLGVLAGGIAHDFNNALAVILNSAAFLTEDLDAHHPCRADVDRIINAASRSAALTNQLLLFARQEVVQAETLDLNTVLANLQDMIVRTVGEDVEVECRLSAGPHPVRMERNKLEQIVLNLVANSRMAMSGGGFLHIETAQLTVADTDGIDTAAGPYVRLRVSDTGCGMPPEVVLHAFDPFFTTKGPGEGTGLGLSTADGAVRQAGGCITLRSAPGRGATVDLYLPTAALENQTPRVTVPLAVPEGEGETVLLVEDEDAVRDVVKRILLRHRYRVIAVASAQEALNTYAASDRRIDVLLTDMIMPGLSGAQLAERLRQDRPDLPTLYMSGYTGDRSREHHVPGVEITVIQKPFAASALLTRLREVLTTQSSAAITKTGSAQHHAPPGVDGRTPVIRTGESAATAAGACAPHTF